MTPTQPKLIHEMVARLIVLLLLAAVVVLPLSARAIQNRSAQTGSMLEIHAAVSENGGWMPGVIRAQTGKPLTLRLTSDDVMHGFAVGQSDAPAVDVIPGKYSQTTLIFEKPGKYVYYCTRWCGVNHWRMRGTIEVSGREPETAPTVEAPLFLKLGIDPDAPHPASVVPAQKPSAERGAALAARLPGDILTADEYEISSPASVWQRLRAEPTLADLSDADLWDLTAYAWQANSTPADRLRGRELYAQNCAACHGEGGGGDGVFADQLAPPAAASAAHDPAELPGSMRLPPADLSDSQSMLGASPALLEGKIIRGGMGTGMPYWGPIFNRQDIQAIINYLYSFQFEEQKEP